ncbi:MAG: ABC transporter ATP-binding protein [Gammaproteobacteria bacterium]|nr:ABC transporter ATP-binding protein [Gammaproteobacteria bacterium]
MTVLEVDIKRKEFSNAGLCALEDMHFNAAPGEFLAIVGPSGAGKSTLLNIVAGLDQDIIGRVRLDGRSLVDGTGSRSRIGFMFQDARLMPWLTVLENVLLVLDDSKDRIERAHDLLRQVGLDEFAKAYPGQLSGGMQRRVALARAFAVQPTLLLMDEPFLSLDAPSAERLRASLLNLWGLLQPTILFVTHNLREALALADRVLFMSVCPGRVVLSLPVQLPRPRSLEDNIVSELHDKLLSEHPELLSGLVNSIDGPVTEIGEAENQSKGGRL